jgi:hypothetical protein
MQIIQMNWQAFVEKLPRKDSENGYEFFPPVESETVLQFFRTFPQEMPEQLGELYKQTNGINYTWQGMVIGTLIWPLERVIEENLNLRSDSVYKVNYMPFDHFLFFADSGFGDLFGFVIINGELHNNKIFVWNHEDDSRTWAAPSLKTFLEWWSQGKVWR